MTYLEAVNNVLRRLREEEVASVNNTKYSKQIGVMINDAKVQVENAYSWSALQSIIPATTVFDVTAYSLVGSGDRSRVIDNYNSGLQGCMYLEPWAELAMKRLRDDISGIPNSYAFNGVDVNGDSKISVYPKPDSAYNLSFLCVVPQPTLDNDADIILVPFLPVVLGAYARAAAERGEDQGLASNEAYNLYKDALSDAIALENSRTAEEATWTA